MECCRGRQQLNGVTGDVCADVLIVRLVLLGMSLGWRQEDDLLAKHERRPCLTR